MRKLPAAMAAVALLACERAPSTTGPGPGDPTAQVGLLCQYTSTDGLFAGSARDGIPALSILPWFSLRTLTLNTWSDMPGAHSRSGDRLKREWSV